MSIYTPSKRARATTYSRGQLTVAKRQATPRKLMAQLPCRFTTASFKDPSLLDGTYWIHG